MTRSVGDVALLDRRREGIWHQVDDQLVGKRCVAAGVGSAGLNDCRGLGACAHRQRDGGGPGKGDVVGDDLAVHQQLNVSHLLIVTNVEDKVDQ